MADFSFQDLTPDLILDAIEVAGLYPTSGLLALNSYENRVYQFLAENSAGEVARYVAKFYRPGRWSTDAILEEHTFTYDLAAFEIPVVCPLRLPLESPQTTLLETHGYRFALFPSVGGRALEPEQWEQLEDLGRHLGRLHQVGKAQPFVHRPPLVSTELLRQHQQTLLACALLPESLKPAMAAILEPVIAQILKVDWSRYQHIRLHGDCHIGNLLWSDQGLTLVDFDDCRQGPAIQDLWMMLSGERYQQEAQLETLLAGYEEFCEFDPKELALIEPLRAFRIIQYMAWLAVRWSDPAFPRSFSWFAEPRYWEQQILTLKEQLSAFAEPPLNLQSGL
ncbi:MAG: serine/threonine protein kinase [Aliidiomarina sp.]|uniref:serine/threonine protein kinase n=1 Tax=Aliidiomarina sp. TaxID=1872439 RepID=UPI0025C1A9AD|nr:serine/threonine protein kinase [Aliidiomarina sp.]MCH8502576.1 serine/threonine protein kinase [Aliidiomarina sp.]